MCLHDHSFIPFCFVLLTAIYPHYAFRRSLPSSRSSRRPSHSAAPNSIRIFQCEIN
ncbi:hypothetical protein ASPFODRAFT_684014 [Aspergillus luchuensis CBS 106.47]|uniref:Uncharacterized protein n=1 Tax=Aspergillus luchuensis (strain CBS 106.47) TaxID=1137211 RepID=A0A1M3TCS6_ASPLC|nr:hypothetical protein ASPFODRAFT_684014 [Aspergillus luchuensis CBS 106.47]